MGFHKNLKYYREKAGLTRQNLADAIGVSLSAVGQYEQGRREPNFDILKRISEILGVTADVLLREENEMSKQRVEKQIADLAKGFGFQFEGDLSVLGWGTKQDSESWVKVNINVEAGDVVKNGVQMNITGAKASLCRAGSFDNPEDMAKAAEELQRAARFVEHINNFAEDGILTYVEKWHH